MVVLWRGRDGRYGYTLRDGYRSTSGDCLDRSLRRLLDACWASAVIARCMERQIANENVKRHLLRSDAF